MYGLVFYFFYRHFLNKNDRSPRFGAICGIFLTIGLHIILAYVVIQEIVGQKLLNPLSQNYYWSKTLNMLVALPFFVLTIIFFKKERVDSIIDKYDKRSDTFNFINWLFFLCLTVVPLALIILLLQK
jgi:SNF family Na+-dependent transporter